MMRKSDDMLALCGRCETGESDFLGKFQHAKNVEAAGYAKKAWPDIAA